MVPETDPVSFARQRAAGEKATLLDVREGWEREICAIPDSVHIPLSSLPARMAELPQDVPIVVVCHHGGRSAQATAWLLAHGYEDVKNLQGGVDAWARSVDPTMMRY